MAPEKEECVQYDLTHRMTPFMDRHMILPILAFAEKSELYNTEDVIRAQVKILADTNMMDLSEEKLKEINEALPAGWAEQREEKWNCIEDSRQRAMGLLEALEEEDKVKKMRDFKTMDDLFREFQITQGVLDEFLIYAKHRFNCGDYPLTSALLNHYRAMPHTPAGENTPPTPAQVRSLWGHLAASLLTDISAQQSPPMGESTAELVRKLDEYLEASEAPKREVLLHRTWLLHWTLFAIFKGDKPDASILEFFLKEKSLSIISLSCPHLLRYVGACLILNKRLKHLVKDTIWIIHHEVGNYSDPVTRFLLALYVEMDYDEAQRELQKCEQLCKSDYFLADHWADFQENARLHIFESYCRIHQCISIQNLAAKLNMQPEEAELWIVKLIQNAKLDARIDSEKSRVVMTKAPPNVYQQVIEKTKNLAFRSTMLVSKMEKEKN